MYEALDEISEACRNNAVFLQDDFEKGGLLHCGVCKTPKQCRIILNGMERIEYCMCDCQNRAYMQERKNFLDLQKREAVARRKQVCFRSDSELYHSRFIMNDGTGDENIFKIFRNYALNFETALKENHGLLIYGNVGSGKTFASACIANQVIESGYSAYFTNFSEIKNTLWNTNDKQEFVRDICSYDLLVIDDFGTESDNRYTNEIVTNIFDTRVKQQKPMVLTSNLTPEQLKKSGEIEYQRIISRVLGNCMAIKYVSADRRMSGRTKHLDFYQKISGGK